MELSDFGWIYLIMINIVTFVVFGIDKYKAKHHKWRVSEKMLFALSIIGGTIGALSAMLVFHHKINKSLFKYGIPLILLFQVILLIK